MELNRESINYISLNGSVYFDESVSPNSTRSGGMILKERRHYLAAGLGVYLKNSDDVSPVLSFQVEGAFFVTPIFGLGISLGFTQLDYARKNATMIPDTAANSTNYTNFSNSKYRSRVNVNQILVMPTFSIPLKFMAIDYKLFGGPAFGKYHAGTSSSYTTYYIRQDRNSGSLYTSRGAYTINESKSVGISFGAGTAFRFNISKKHPITFSTGIDFLYSQIKFEYDVNGTLDSGESEQWKESTTFTHASLRPYVMFVYSLQKRQ